MVVTFDVTLFQKSPELSDFILDSDAGTMFSLSWIITWFAYVIDDESTINRYKYNMTDTK